MMEDHGYVNSGHMPPILQPLPTPSKLSTVSAEYIYSHPEFRHTLPAYYMTPISYHWQVKTLNEDHYVQSASKTYHNPNFGKKNNLNPFKFNTIS